MTLRRVLAAVALVALAGAGWYLGSPLFIRTTTYEAFPVPSAAPLPAASATAAAAATTPAAPQTLARGELGYVDAIHNGRGSVLLLRAGDAPVVRFEDVAITNAPDVHVYLSRDAGGRWSEATSLYLGPLKATNGSFNYALPPGTDVGPYRSVVVWCRQFAVLITWADLH